MKQIIIILICAIMVSCSVLKPKPTPIQPKTDSVPNVMSRSIPKLPSLPTIPTKDLTTVMRDSVYKMALRMDTILYGYYTTARGQSKVIDSLVKGNEKNQRELSSLKKAVEKMQWIDFNGNDFTVTVVNDTTVGVSIKARPLPQPVGRKEAEPTLRWLYTQSIQYPIYND